RGSAEDSGFERRNHVSRRSAGEARARRAEALRRGPARSVRRTHGGGRSADSTNLPGACEESRPRRVGADPYGAGGGHRAASKAGEGGAGAAASGRADLTFLFADIP